MHFHFLFLLEDEQKIGMGAFDNHIFLHQFYTYLLLALVFNKLIYCICRNFVHIAENKEKGKKKTRKGKKGSAKRSKRKREKIKGKRKLLEKES